MEKSWHRATVGIEPDGRTPYCAIIQPDGKVCGYYRGDGITLTMAMKFAAMIDKCNSLTECLRQAVAINDKLLKINKQAIERHAEMVEMVKRWGSLCDQYKDTALDRKPEDEKP